MRARSGPHDVDLCKMAMQTERGWYVSRHDAPCEGETRGATVSTRIDSFRWADELGPGILLARASHEDEVRIESWRWWGGVQISFADSRSSLALCGMGHDDTPYCTDRLVDQCSSAISSDGAIRFLGGKIEVADAASTMAQCLGEVPAPGSYAIALRGAEPGPRRWVPPDDPTERESSALETGRIEATPAYGPFASPFDYCRDLPDFGVWQDQRLSAEDERAPARRKEACAAPSATWSGALQARGALRAIRLLRVKNDMAGAVIHHCRIGLQTDSGWFFTTDYDVCQGVIGPGVTTDTRALPLRWSGDAQHPIVWLEARTGSSRASFRMGPRDDGFAFGGQQPSTTISRTIRRLKLCALGPSGIPSCTPWIFAGCFRAGTKVTHDVAWNGTSLSIVPDGALAEEEQFECEVERTSYQVTFP